MAEKDEYLQVKQDVENLGKQIDQKVSDINTKAENGEKISKENTAEIQKLVKQYQEQQEQLDQINTERKRGRMGGHNLADEQKMPADLIREALEKSTDFSDLQKKGKGRASISLPDMTAKSLEQKATMLTGAVAPGTVIMPQYIPGIVAPNLRRTTLLDLIPVAPTTSNAITYVRESAYTSNGAYVAEGGTKPEDDLTLAQVTAPVQVLATTMRVSKQLLDDLPALVGYIAVRTPQKLRLVKEQAVMYGSGTGAEITGIATVASAFTDPSGVVVPSANNYDVLGAAILQAQIAEYFPTGIVIHPQDEYLMLHAKDSQGRYLFPEMRDGMIGSVPYAVSTLAALKGNFLVGDFALGSQLFQRQGLEIELFDQDRDNVQKNLITIRAEERHALAIYRPDAFVYGNFATAKAALGS